MRARLILVGRRAWAALLAGLLCCTGLHALAAAPERVVWSGMAAPGGGLFDRFQVTGHPAFVPINDSGQIAFFATVVRAPHPEGIFLAGGKKIESVALAGQSIPSAGRLEGFARHPVPALGRDGSVAFAATLSGAGSSEGLFLRRAGRAALDIIALSGRPAPGIPGGTFSGFDSPGLNANGDVVFLASVRTVSRRGGPESEDAVYIWRRGKLAKVAAVGDRLAGGGSVTGFGVPQQDDRAGIVFPAMIEGGAAPGGIVRAAGNELSVLLPVGSDAGGGAIVAQFSEHLALNGRGQIAANAALKLGTSPGGMFLIEGHTLKAVARVGADAPGGGRYAAFAIWPAISGNGDVAYVAAIDGGQDTVAIFQARTDSARRLLSLRDKLADGGEIASFSLYPALAASPRGNLALLVLVKSEDGTVESLVRLQP